MEDGSGDNNLFGSRETTARRADETALTGRETDCVNGTACRRKAPEGQVRSELAESDGGQPVPARADGDGSPAQAPTDGEGSPARTPEDGEESRRRLEPARTVVVITGLSGAGKSYASHALEDAGFYCVDNLPPDLIKQFVQLAGRGAGDTRLALVCDVRGGERFEDLFRALAGLKKLDVAHRIIFLEASDEVLMRRFSETRRRHPLDTGSLRDDIARERELLADVRCRADVIIDTSDYSVSRLKERMLEVVDARTESCNLNVRIISFGFKYGIPLESDLLFDVRFLPNPHYVPELAPLTGRVDRVQQYVLDSDTSRKFRTRLLDFLDFLMPQYLKEGKTHLSIAVGCTGGRHRSVTFAEILGKHLRSNGFRVLVDHRDLER